MIKITENIAILGSGAWGRTLGLLLASTDCNITLWDIRDNLENELESFYDEMAAKGHLIKSRPKFIPELKNAVSECNLVIFVLPTGAVREVAGRINGIINTSCSIVIATKGIEKTDNKFSLMIDIINEELGSAYSIGVLSGPNLSIEIQERNPAVSIIASQNNSLIEKIMKLLSSEIFRVYGSHDIKGVQIGGAVKNPIAIAAGMLDELGFKFNTKAALLTRGLVEITRLGEKIGGERETFAGISGLGDLICTASSPTSRNYRAGRMFAKGKNRDEIQNGIGEIIEGISNSKSIIDLAHSLGVEMPISQGVYNVVWDAKDPLTELRKLMTRDLKYE